MTQEAAGLHLTEQSRVQFPIEKITNSDTQELNWFAQAVMVIWGICLTMAHNKLLDKDIVSILLP